jgi:protein TonB
MYFTTPEKHSFYFMKKLSFIFLFFVAFTGTLSAQDVDTTIFIKVDIEAQFPGGENEWNKYVMQTLEKKIDKLVKDKKSSGTCEMQFIVSKDGSLSNIEALTLKNSLLAKLLTDALKKSPQWLPAQQNGKPVKAWRRQKVTFRPPVD